MDNVTQFLYDLLTERGTSTYEWLLQRESLDYLDEAIWDRVTHSEYLTEAVVNYVLQTANYEQIKQKWNSEHETL